MKLEMFPKYIDLKKIKALFVHFQNNARYISDLSYTHYHIIDVITTVT